MDELLQLIRQHPKLKEWETGTDLSLRKFKDMHLANSSSAQQMQADLNAVENGLPTTTSKKSANQIANDLSLL